ncbi:Arginine decarboxylase 1 [Capsicum annuum]|nr:Arginine decarboxylase 1 [Capsicum annuum]
MDTLLPRPFGNVISIVFGHCGFFHLAQDFFFLAQQGVGHLSMGTSLVWARSIRANLAFISAGHTAVSGGATHSTDTLPHQEIDLLKVVKKASDQINSGGLGLQLPLVVRFPDVLKNQLELLQLVFDYVVQSQGYEAHYQEEKLDLVIDISRKIAVQPVIVLQAKLRTKHFSHFGSTSGEKGNFGLTIRQLLRVVKNLKESGMLDCLRLLDFYIGSMNLSTNLLAEGVGEDAQVYCELVCLGAGIKFIDAGGGLGIDYDGTKSCDSDVLVGYGLQEYASTVVQAIQFVCDSKKVKHLVICSKSGRVIVSHHSVLIF